MRRFSIVLAATIAAVAPGQDLGASVDALCRPLVDAELYVGMVVGVIDGDATFVRGYGRVAAGGEAVPDGKTVYEIGSISKVFTGLLLADAIERGLVGLDDAVEPFVPNGVRMPRKDDKQVTFRHLATHTSGLPRLPPGKPENPDDPYAHLSGPVLLHDLAETKLNTVPGERYAYSNLGTGLLGYLLVQAERASSYDRMLRFFVTDSLGLDDTVVELQPSHRERLAPPYDADGSPSHNWDLAALAGAGGVRSTVDDMLAFARFELQPRGSLAIALQRSQNPLWQQPDGPALAYCWHLDRGGAVLWHNGETGGYHGFFAIEPAARRAVCILANTARSELDAAGRGILARLRGEAVAPPVVERPVAVERAVLERYVGAYRVGADVEFAVTLRPQGLFAQLGDQPALRLFARSPTEFFYRAVPASLTFEVDGATVQAAVLHQGGRDERFARIAPAPVK